MLTDAKALNVRQDVGVGGHVVLDFVNTCGGAGKERDVERLLDWHGAIDWAIANGVLSPADSRLVEKARSRARCDPSDILMELRALREAMHAVFSSIAGGVSPSATARSQLEGFIVEAMRHSTLRIEGRAPTRWTVRPEEAGCALIKDRLAVAASELLSQAIVSNVRECGACSWLFLDLSRSKSRRWCSMATCGNRAKAQRHYRMIRTTS